MTDATGFQKIRRKEAFLVEEFIKTKKRISNTAL